MRNHRRGTVRLLRLTALGFACAAALIAAPTLTGVYNAASWVPPKLPNSGIAQGGIFTVTGSGLGPAALQQVQSYPLPTTQGLGGTSIQVTVGGVTENCIMIYTVATQVAAILPSATPVGTGTLTLSYQGAKNAIAIQVLAANFGTFTLNEAGTGPGVLTDSSYSPITMINAAHPGQALILWGTGLGAVTGDETQPPESVDLGSGVQVLVGNQPATVLYGGRSSSPGLDQINFVVPAGINGCKASIAVVVKGVTGNVTSTSVPCRANHLRRYHRPADGGQPAKGPYQRLTEHGGHRDQPGRRRERHPDRIFREPRCQQLHPVVRRDLPPVGRRLYGL